MRKVEYTGQEDGCDNIPISRHTFPAKLWALVNDQQVRSVWWDASGLAVVIDQDMFEAEVMGNVTGKRKRDNVFQTTNFSSFIRQLNLYGFRKVVSSLCCPEIPKEIKIVLLQRLQHCFYNPNFKRGYPELLLNLKRLTSVNKAKIKAGLEVRSRPVGFRQAGQNGSMQAASAHLGSLQGSESSYPSLQNGPLPQSGWIMGPSVSSSPSECFMGKDMPIAVVQPMSIGLPAQYSPRFCTPAMYHYCSPGSMTPDITGSAQQPSPSTVYNSYQPGFLHPCDQQWQSSMNEAAVKEDVTLSEAMQMLDELQGPPKPSALSVETPESLILHSYSFHTL